MYLYISCVEIAFQVFIHIYLNFFHFKKEDYFFNTQRIFLYEGQFQCAWKFCQFKILPGQVYNLYF